MISQTKKRENILNLYKVRHIVRFFASYVIESGIMIAIYPIFMYNLSC